MNKKNEEEIKEEEISEFLLIDEDCMLDEDFDSIEGEYEISFDLCNKNIGNRSPYCPSSIDVSLIENGYYKVEIIDVSVNYFEVEKDFWNNFIRASIHLCRILAPLKEALNKYNELKDQPTIILEPEKDGILQFFTKAESISDIDNKLYNIYKEASIGLTYHEDDSVARFLNGNAAN